MIDWSRRIDIHAGPLVARYCPPMTDPSDQPAHRVQVEAVDIDRAVPVLNMLIDNALEQYGRIMSAHSSEATRQVEVREKEATARLQVELNARLEQHALNVEQVVRPTLRFFGWATGLSLLALFALAAACLYTENVSVLTHVLAAIAGLCTSAPMAYLAGTKNTKG